MQLVMKLSLRLATVHAGHGIVQESIGGEVGKGGVGRASFEA